MAVVPLLLFLLKLIYYIQIRQQNHLTQALLYVTIATPHQMKCIVIIYNEEDVQVSTDTARGWPRPQKRQTCFGFLSKFHFKIMQITFHSCLGSWKYIQAWAFVIPIRFQSRGRRRYLINFREDLLTGQCKASFKAMKQFAVQCMDETQLF